MPSTQIAAMDVRIGDQLSLDSGNYIVRVEHIALVRGTNIEITYRAGRSLQTHTIVMNKYGKISVIR